jgi:hypothetical protein
MRLLVPKDDFLMVSRRNRSAVEYVIVLNEGGNRIACRSRKKETVSDSPSIGVL